MSDELDQVFTDVERLSLRADAEVVEDEEVVSRIVEEIRALLVEDDGANGQRVDDEAAVAQAPVSVLMTLNAEISRLHHRIGHLTANQDEQRLNAVADRGRLDRIERAVLKLTEAVERLGKPRKGWVAGNPPDQLPQGGTGPTRQQGAP